MSYDQRCHDLAAVFIDGLNVEPEARDRLTHQLAVLIQDTIESYCEYDADVVLHTLKSVTPSTTDAK